MASAMPSSRQPIAALAAEAIGTTIIARIVTLPKMT
jgi:hypothetical protein